MTSQSSVLVIGATGKVGSQVVRQLSKKVQVHAAVRSKNTAELISDPQVKPVEVDLNQPATISAALNDVEKLFLMTPLVKNTVEISGSIITEAKKSGIRKIVKLSAMGSGPNSSLTLGRWHDQADNALKSSGIPYTILRPNSFMQNYLAFRDSIKNQGVFYSPLEDSKVSLIDTRDIASVATEALIKDEHDNKTYELTGPEALSEQKIAEILSSVAGKKIKHVNISDEVARKSMITGGMPEWLADCLIELFDSQKAGHMSVISPAVKQITGKEPISFSQFAVDNAKIFKD